MAYDEGLVERLRTYFDGKPDISEKNMFGGRCFLKNGNMCVVVFGDDLMAPVGPESYAVALERPHVTPKMKGGKDPMTGFVLVAPEGIADDAALAQWVAECEKFVGTLKPK